MKPRIHWILSPTQGARTACWREPKRSRGLLTTQDIGQVTCLSCRAYYRRII